MALVEATAVVDGDRGRRRALAAWTSMTVAGVREDLEVVALPAVVGFHAESDAVRAERWRSGSAGSGGPSSARSSSGLERPAARRERRRSRSGRRR